MTARFCVGIDLGTTNSALAYAEPDAVAPRITVFPVPQLTAPGVVAARQTLPSFLYLPATGELPAGATRLPWSSGDPDRVVGELARNQMALVPGRGVSSAKSWLCHAEVDRTAAILPWGGAADAPRLSPVAASAEYLRHLAGAWAAAHPDAPLGEQDVVLTVPASFDEVARELTVDAARKAGLERVTLLEEPQAAFYSWMADHQEGFADALGAARLVLVCDVGGGTTDFTLIRVELDGGTPKFERIAVGDHLLLGGDNMDLALAHGIERKLAEGSGAKLDARQWHALGQACRAAKELLLADDGPARTSVTVAGRGSRLIGGALSTDLARDEALARIADGFFPLVPADARPVGRSSGLKEWGLPYAADPAITKHLAAFLGKQGGALPDAVLFNGGALKPRALRERVVGALASWRGGAVGELQNESPDLAVARGATYYGLVRRGKGARIGGGSARGYYVEVESGVASADEVGVVCVAPRGMEEGREVELGRELRLVTNRPVRFHVFCASDRADALGAAITLRRDALLELPPIYTVIRAPASELELPVRMRARLDEIGTLALSLASPATGHAWRLAFDMRAERRTGPPPPSEAPAAEAPPEELAPDAIAAASTLVRGVFGKTGTEAKQAPGSLVKDLERLVGRPRDEWPLASLRQLWEALREVRGDRGKTAEHEQRWLNLAGFVLRPGYGVSLDDWRMRELWRVFKAPLVNEGSDPVRIEYWTMWRRVAGGLSSGQQEEIWNRIGPYLLPRATKRAPPRKPPQPAEAAEMWRLSAALERLGSSTKAAIGDALLGRIEKGAKVGDYAYWALGRVGARAPLHGPAHQVIPRATVEPWLERLLQLDFTDGKLGEQLGFTVGLLARRTGDRARDIDEALRARVGERLAKVPGAGARLRQLVAQQVKLEAKEERAAFGDSLPAGLKLVVSEDAPVERTPTPPPPTTSS